MWQSKHRDQTSRSLDQRVERGEAGKAVANCVTEGGCEVRALVSLGLANEEDSVRGSIVGHWVHQATAMGGHRE